MFTWDTLPEQPFGSPPKNFKGSQKHFGGDLGTVGAVPGRLRVALESAWFHFGAILEPCWRVSSTTVAKGHFPSVCQSSVLKDVSNEITIHRGSGQICRGDGGGGFARKTSPAGETTEGERQPHTPFHPFQGSADIEDPLA